MSTPMHNQVEQAYAEMRRQRELIAAASAELSAAKNDATSKNRAVTVTVDSRGEVTAIKFLNNTYRSMPGPELAQLLIDTISAARNAGMNRTAQRFQSFMPEGMSALAMLKGEFDIDKMIDDAVRKMNDPQAPPFGSDPAKP